MPAESNLEIEVHLEDSGAPPSMEREILDGLSRTPKQLPSKYFYDERGSRLFERITHLPEYYLTRAEYALLLGSADEIMRLSRPRELVELGSGVAGKIRLLLDAGLRRGTLERYVPVEVSEAVVERSARELAGSYPDLEIHALVGDFELHLGKLQDGGARLIALLGSTIGNYPHDEAVEFLRKVTHVMGPDDSFLMGCDVVKDKALLEAAYNDGEGVTAEFNRNILNVVNRHLDGNFDLQGFEHVAVYNELEARIESYLRSKRRQMVRLRAIDLDVPFAQGELLWTEVSGKFTRESVSSMLEAAGMRLTRWFTDDDRTFASCLARLA